MDSQDVNSVLIYLGPIHIHAQQQYITMARESDAPKDFKEIAYSPFRDLLAHK